MAVSRTIFPIYDHLTGERLLGDVKTTAFLPTIRELEALSRDVQGGLSENCLFGKLTDVDAWAATMPEEETQSLRGVRSQRRRCLRSVDE